jgi:uncharacterized protein
MTVTRARASVVWFLGVVAVLTSIVQCLIWRTHDTIDKHVELVLPLMWIPGVVSVVLRLVRKEGFSDVSFRWGGKRTWKEVLRVWLYPLVVGALAYGIAWGFGLEVFEVKVHGGALSTAPIRDFAKRLLLTLSIGVPLSAISAFGEELGWRGYLLTRMIQAKVPRPVLMSGLIWGLWHTPMILSGQYAAGPYPVLSALVFVLAILPDTYIHAQARLASGSLWPAVIAHSTWNSVIQGAFDASTRGGGSGATTSIWIGESGLLVITFAYAVTFLILPRTWTMRLAPSDEGEPLEFKRL